MLKNMVCAKEVGELVPQILSGQKEVQYHSVFENSFNLLVGEDLLHISREAKQVTPFGIQVSKTDFNALKRLYNKAVLFLRKGHLIIGEFEITYLEISFQNTCHTLLNKQDVSSALPFFTPFLNQTGLDLEEVAQDELDVYSLVGRGVGLTPSGDDFLVGLLAVNHCVCNLSSKQLQNIDWAIKEKRTTDVSLAYLKSARLGYFTSTICLLLANISKPALLQIYLRQLAELGHTSGRDTIAGIYQGLTRFLKEEE